MGIVQPRTGMVDIKGQRMNGRPTFKVAQLGIAFVPEGRGIFGNLSVVENLKMAAHPGKTREGTPAVLANASGPMRVWSTPSRV